MLPQTKQVLAINAASTTAAATASGIIDTLGYKHASIDIVATTANVVSNKPTVLKLSHADTTDATNFSDITGFRGGTDFTIADAVTAATAALQNQYKFNVDLRGRKRYLKVSVSPQTTQSITAIANLSRAGEAPITATKAGVLNLVEG